MKESYANKYGKLSPNHGFFKCSPISIISLNLAMRKPVGLQRSPRSLHQLIGFKTGYASGVQQQVTSWSVQTSNLARFQRQLNVPKSKLLKPEFTSSRPSV